MVRGDRDMVAGYALGGPGMPGATYPSNTSSRVHPTHLDALDPLDHVAVMPPKQKCSGGVNAVICVSAYTDPWNVGMERHCTY